MAEQNAWPGEDESGDSGKLQRIVNTTMYAEAMGGLHGTAVLDDDGTGTGLSIYADGSGMVVRRRIGRATVAGFSYHSGVLQTLAVPTNANPQGHARIDLWVIRLDTASQTCQLHRLEGAPAAAPVAPAPVRQVTPTLVWDLPLAEVRVDAAVTSIAASKVIDRRDVRPSLDRMPRGQQVLRAITTNSPADSFVTTTELVIPGLGAAAFHAHIGRAYEVRFHCYSFIASGGGPAHVTLRLRASTVGGISPNSTQLQAMTVDVPDIPVRRPGAAFSHVIDGGLKGRHWVGVTMQTHTAVGLKVAGAPGGPAFLSVTDIGPTAG